MLPARQIEELPSLRPGRPRPRVVRGSRPALEIDKLMTAMEALEGYIDLHLLALETAQPPPIVSDAELETRLASL